jgi:hypothetical protein
VGAGTGQPKAGAADEGTAIVDQVDDLVTTAGQITLAMLLDTVDETTWRS